MNFQTLSQLAVLCGERELGIGALMLEEQSAESGRSKEQEFATMREYYGVMKEAVQRGMTEDTTSRSGLTGLDAQRVAAYNAAEEPCLGGRQARRWRMPLPSLK